MTTKLVTLAMLAALSFTSCKEAPKEAETPQTEITATEPVAETNPLVGAWVEPNPINANEVQGLQINEDGSAASINMATLVYKKWWKDADKLVLVSESIGNGVTILDTTKFEIIKLSEQELELKGENYSLKYTRQK